MKKSDLLSKTDDELVDLFAKSGIRCFRLEEEAEHENEADIRRLSREIKWGWAVRDELKRRGPEARLKLTSLYDHPNLQVRLNAATATLAVAPVEARRLIERIAGSHEFPQAGEAGMRLVHLDNGIFKPS